MLCDMVILYYSLCKMSPLGKLGRVWEGFPYIISYNCIRIYNTVWKYLESILSLLSYDRNLIFFTLKRKKQGDSY